MALFEQKKDPATMQTAAGYPEVKSMDTKLAFSANEIETLRTFGKMVAEISARPAMKKKSSALASSMQ